MTYTPAQITVGDRVVARVAEDILRENNNERLKRFTAFISWRGEDDCEEIDVDAVNEQYARECVKAELAQGYEPGGTIRQVEQRFGLYM
jgi:hypothetical protein